MAHLPMASASVPLSHYVTETMMGGKKHGDPEASDPSPKVPRNKGHHYADVLIAYLEHSIWEFYPNSMNPHGEIH